MLLRSRAVTFLASVAGVVIGISALGGARIMEAALHPPKLPVPPPTAFAASIARLSATGVQNASVVAQDGAVLKAWYVKPSSWNRSTVILIHGVGDNRAGMSGYAPMFLRAGYAVLLTDSRANGESGGAAATYGLLESDDLKRWSEWLTHQSPSSSDINTSCIDLFGESMGAAIALQATPTVPNLCAVVAEAPFTNFREMGFERIAQATHTSLAFTHIAAWPIVECGLLEARLRYGLDMNKVNPQAALVQSGVPALLIAGLADDNIPPRHAQQIHRAAPDTTELWEVPNARHTAASSAAPEEFQRRVLAWFQSHRHR